MARALDLDLLADNRDAARADPDELAHFYAANHDALVAEVERLRRREEELEEALDALADELANANRDRGEDHQ